VTAPLPGDFEVVTAGGAAGKFVHIAQLLAGGGKYSEYEHVAVYIGDGMVLQAEPGGSRITPMTGHAKTLWSTSIIDIPDEARARVPELARAMERIPYSYLDYTSIAAHRLYIPAPHLRAYIRATGHMQCAQLTDEFLRRLGVHLFADERWEGDVMPADLARLLSEAAHVTG
jgi:hypothetical protein